MSENEKSDLEPEARLPTSIDRFFMPYKAVRIELLDQIGDPILVPANTLGKRGPAVASGFLMRVNKVLYLYTCWHVVTGIDLSDAKVPGTMARRTTLRISMGNNDYRGGLARTVDGLLQFNIDLWDASTSPGTPLWEQDELSTPNDKLDLANLKQPKRCDVVRLRVPESVQPVEQQILSPGDLWPGFLTPGDRLLLVGYPYGYSASTRIPTPIVVTRFAASMPEHSHEETLIDGGGAKGMSGGPVFCDSPDGLFLFGMYTGLLFPDMAAGNESPDRTTALGKVCPLRFLFDHSTAPRPQFVAKL